MSVFYKPETLTRQLAETHNEIRHEIESSLRLVMAQSIELMEVKPLLTNISDAIIRFNADVEAAKQAEPFSAARLDVLRFKSPPLESLPQDKPVNSVHARDFLLAILDKPAHASKESAYAVLLNSMLDKARGVTTKISKAEQHQHNIDRKGKI